jgi:ABC-2 type transport system ATP-binding protein
MCILKLDHVVKRFGDFTAVNDLSFEVPEGGIFGFLGGNGAGKTTSLRMALDIIRPTSGSITILDRKPGRENAAEIGFLPEERGLYRRMSVIDTIVYFGQIKGMEQAAAKKEAERLIERFGLGELTKSMVEKLSKGMSQKVQVAAAMVNKPKLLILDEPFSGLDPVNQKVLEDLVVEMAEAGSTVVFSTHIMQHAERLTDRIVLLARGRKVFEGTQEEARGALPGRLRLESQNDPSGLPGVVSAKRSETDQGWTSWEVSLAPGTSPGNLLQVCTAQGFALRAFESQRPSLHDVFIHLVGVEKELAQ